MKNPYKFWMILSLIAVFIVGTLFGVFMENVFLEKHNSRRKGSRDRPPFPTMDTMAEELKLTEEQQEQIRDIFRRNDERLRALHKQIRQEFRDIRGRIMEEISGVLDASQKEKFQTMIDRYHSERRKEYDARKKGPDRPQKDKGDR